MKLALSFGICAITLGMFASGCAASESSEDSPEVSEGELNTRLTAGQALHCETDSGKTKIGLVSSGAGKFALVTLATKGDLYTVSHSSGTLTTSASKWTWKGASSSLKLTSSMKGVFERGSRSTAVTCEMANSEAAAWRAANAIADYADEIDGLADTVLEESNDPRPKAYTVYAVETSRRSSLALGTVASNSTGALPGDEGEERLDENEQSYGGMSAAYGLGGGDDYGEWFQGASDGISLAGDLAPALTNGARAGIIAHENVAVLKPLVDSTKPSAVEITVGAWTFLLPDAFPK